MRWVWLAGGLIALGCGLIGVVLPLVPTVPFVLLAAFFFARSSDRLHDWLINHPSFGPSILAWRDHGAITRRAKILAAASITLAFGIAVALDVRPSILVVHFIVLSCVTVFIWSRPEN